MRPPILTKDTVLRWTIHLYDPSTNELVDADSDPTITVYKDNVSTADAVTVTKRAATVGTYDCSYDPVGETAGQTFTIHESSAITSLGGGPYEFSWSVPVVEPEFDPSTTTVDVGAIAGNANAATNLAASADTIKRCTVDTTTNTHTPTVTEFQTAELTEATAEHFNGRIVYFKTGALADQATDITSYSQVGGIGQLTVTALTEAPADGDEFIII